MHVVESLGFYFPESSGGTEVYVSDLARGLREQGIKCTVAAPSPSETFRQLYEGTEVFRYPVPTYWERREIQGLDRPRQFDVFEDWLRQQRAEVYHQHSWTSACGIWHLEAAKRLGMKTVVTVHVPGNICLRGTMLHEGRSACDGEIRAERCALCWLQSRGMSAAAARRLIALPQGLGPLVRLLRLGPALAAKALVAEHRRQLQQMAATADKVIAVCGWLYDALAVNGISEAKLVLNRQGVGQSARSIPLKPSIKSSNGLRFGFLGRYDPLKGLHTLVDAFRRLPPDLPAKLDICAVGSDELTRQYRELILRSVAGDQRIRILPALARHEVASFLSSIDALVVPSQWLETGPLVVLEAFAAGTPVIGSELGGIKELITDERNGLLVPHADVSAWTAALARLATDRALLQRLRQGFAPLRTMSDVARDMAGLYRDLFPIGINAA